MKKIMLVILVSLLTGCDKLGWHKASTAHATQLNPIDPKVYVVGGQSNMQALGQSFPTPLLPGVTWRGLDFPRGAAAAFANGYAQQTGQQVIIAQCSVGGTSIYEWQPGGALYNQCLSIIHNIQADTANVQIAGILFWQGEKDAQVPNVPWASLFDSMIRGFRADLGDNNIPVVYAQIDTNQQFNQAPLYPYWTWIQDQQAGAEGSLPLMAMVKTSDITTLSDSVHVDASGLAIIGQRMLANYFDLLNE